MARGDFFDLRLYIPEDVEEIMEQIRTYGSVKGSRLGDDPPSDPDLSAFAASLDDD